MTTYTKSGSFGWAGGGKSGAIVDLWATSRFGSFPIQGQAPPTGSPDAGPVTTGSDEGNPGGYLLTGIPSVQDYYVRIQYGGTAYWGGCPAGTLAGQPAQSGGVSLIESFVLATPTIEFLFSGIPSVYNHLRLVMVARSSDAAESEGYLINLNGDVTSGHYDVLSVYGIGTLGGTNADTASANFSAWFPLGGSPLPAANATAGVAGLLELDIPAYSQTTFQKVGKLHMGYIDYATSNADGVSMTQDCVWRNTAAVTQLTVKTLSGDAFVVGSSAYLYGIT